jgi:hypothetical protein
LFIRGILDENQFTSARIFNVDEKSHIFWLGSEKVAQKGNFQVGMIIACESGRNITGAYAASESEFVSHRLFQRNLEGKHLIRSFPSSWWKFLLLSGQIMDEH